MTTHMTATREEWLKARLDLLKAEKELTHKSDELSLAAAPTFAIMALLTHAFGGMPDMLCSAAQDASPLSGMVPMYLLMSAFHLSPWLTLISGRRSSARS